MIKMQSFTFLIWISLIVVLNVRAESEPANDDYSKYCHKCNDITIPECQTTNHLIYNRTINCIQHELDENPCIIGVVDKDPEGDNGEDFICLFNNKSSTLELQHEAPISHHENADVELVADLASNGKPLASQVQNEDEDTAAEEAEVAEAPADPEAAETPAEEPPVAETPEESEVAEAPAEAEASAAPEETETADTPADAEAAVAPAEAETPAENEPEETGAAEVPVETEVAEVPVEDNAAGAEKEEEPADKDYPADEPKPDADAKKPVDGDDATAAGTAETDNNNIAETGETIKQPGTTMISCFGCISTDDVNCTVKPVKEVNCKTMDDIKNGCYTLVKVDTNSTIRGCISDLTEEGTKYCRNNTKLCILCYEPGCNNKKAPSSAAYYMACPFIVTLLIALWSVMNI